MATQASAITFISTPGQGYQDGLGFVQNYFGMPLALIIIAAVFLPMYRRLNVYTAYEFLGRRFDAKTRLLGAALFLLQRGLAAGITIYAPAIILSTMLGWRLDLTIILSGLLVDHLHRGRRQRGGDPHPEIPDGRHLRRDGDRLRRPAGETAGQSATDALTVAGGFQKLQAVDFSLDVKRRYTFWSGLLGGLFLSLSYFGTDQSQVQRYISGASLRESRLGLMFNAVFKIPMQFFILLLGRRWSLCSTSSSGRRCSSTRPPGSTRPNTIRRAIAFPRAEIHRDPRGKGAIDSQLARRQARGRPRGRGRRRARRHWPRTSAAKPCAPRPGPPCSPRKPRTKSNDADYVFITFILDHLPHGVIGLLVAAFFAAALSSKAAELNALGSTTTIDFYRHVFKREASDAHYVAASKWFTLLLGPGGDWLRPVREPGGEPDPGRQHRRLGFLRRGARPCSWWRFSCGGSAARPSSGRRWPPRRWSSCSIFRSASAISGIISSAAPPACCSALFCRPRLVRRPSL